uniref:Phosphonate C-P lyase system protein PhnL n=1 Tax=Desulfacinum infernum TaxID=35837 RepID=A0A832EIT3_9BACT
MVRVESVAKTFTLHGHGGIRLCVLNNVTFEVFRGESVALTGPSGIGKSSVLRMIYGNYAADQGRILIRCGRQDIDITAASPRTVLRVRRDAIGYVSQFLRVIPRVSALDTVMEPLLNQGVALNEARQRAEAMLHRLGISRRLWGLSPTTFSGGEQQRVNIARVFVCTYPILLLDEPTASLDPRSRDTVVTLIREAWHRGAAVLGVYHDTLVRRQAADRGVSLEPFASTSQTMEGGCLNGSVHAQAL